MIEDRPPASHRKTSLVAPIVIGAIIVALLAAVLLLNRPDKSPTRDPAPPAPVAEAPPTQAPIPLPGPLSRQEMIQAAASETAAYTAGTTVPRAARPLKGRRFVLRIPFGCEGPQASPGGAQAFVERDVAGKSVKLVARPSTWTALPIMQGQQGAAAPEAVEGFWLPRPWTYAETCPPQGAGRVPATPTPAATQTLGLARLYEADGSRILRRDGRAYEFVRTIPADQPAAPMAYRLVLEGRITGFPDGRAIRCEAESPDHRPICFYAVAFERVAFETADGQVLAEWRE